MNWQWWGIWGPCDKQVLPSLSSSQPFKPKEAIKKNTHQNTKIGDDWGKTLTVVKIHAYIPCTTDLESKKAKDGCESWLGKPPQPPETDFAEGCSKSNSILKLEHFLKPCVLGDYKEKEKTMLFEAIWSLGATSNFTQFYFKVAVK